MCADVVIVGGGPVGLWTAIQLKKRKPALDVQVYERYEEYRRSHVLKLEHRALMLYSKNSYDLPEAKFLAAVTGDNPAKVVKSAIDGEQSFIRTNDLEDALKTYANDLGINISYNKISSPEDVEAQHPECKYFVAADGAHSAMRKALLGEDATKEYPLQYVVEIKYEAAGKTRPLTVTENLKVNQYLSSMCFEYTGREKAGKTPVTLRFFVDEKIYKALPESGFKNPIGLDNKHIPSDLAHDMATYMQARKDTAGEVYKQGSAKISKLELSLYKAKRFATQKRGKNWFLAGDAAMGVPYFRSLNAGMIISSQLGLILTRQLLNGKAKIAAYNAMQPLDTTWEFTAAHGKNIALNIYDGFRKASAKMSWKVQKHRKNRGRKGPGSS